MILLHGYNRPMEDEARRAIQDLEWCLSSPGLITSGAQDYLWPDDDYFTVLAREFKRSAPGASAAMSPPRPPSHHHFRLGQYFEQLLQFWLTSQRRYELIDANLPVNHGGRTIGEFDLLIGEAGLVQHWEAAVKFYLGTGDTRDPANWFGPNTSDRLDIKYQRLVSHQLCLSRQPAASQVLAQRGLVVASSLCFIKGRLFYPFEAYRAGTPTSPPFVNPNHLRGWWLEADAFADTFADAMDPRARYLHLEKRHWLAPLRGSAEDGLSLTQMQVYLTQGREPATHLAVLDENGMEISRGFVVDQRWLGWADSGRG